MGRLVAVLLSVLVVAGAVVPAASSQDSVEETRAERRANAVREAEIAAELDVLAARDEELVVALEDLEVGVAVVEARRDGHVVAAAQAREVERTAREVAGDVRDEIAELQRLLRRLAVELYVSGSNVSPGSVVLGSADPTDAAVREALAGFASRDVDDVVDRLRVLDIELQERAAEAARSALSAEESAAAAAAESERLEELASRKRALREEVDRRRKALEEEAVALRQADADLEAFIVAELAARAEAQRTAAEEAASAAAPTAPLGFSSGDAEPAPVQPRVAQPDTNASGAGTEASPAASGAGSAAGGGVSMIWPLSGSVGSGFGNRVHPIYGTVRFHAGLDIGAPSGTPIAAAAGGVVLSAGWQDGYGETVIVDHGGGLTTVYPHMSGYAVAAGSRVEQGQMVGYVGSTGLSTGPHLHFEVREMGVAQNPLTYLP